jgi:hypothetical protein
MNDNTPVQAAIAIEENENEDSVQDVMVLSVWLVFVYLDGRTC